MRSLKPIVASFLRDHGAIKGIEKDKIITSTELCDAAHRGDVAELRRLVKDHHADVNLGDYDKRTAIHLAASEGLLLVVKFLIEELGADNSPLDRWGGTHSI